MFYLYVYQQQTYLIKSSYLFDITVLNVFIVETESNADICQRIESRARIEVAKIEVSKFIVSRYGTTTHQEQPYDNHRHIGYEYDKCKLLGDSFR